MEIHQWHTTPTNPMLEVCMDNINNYKIKSQLMLILLLYLILISSHEAVTVRKPHLQITSSTLLVQIQVQSRLSDALKLKAEAKPKIGSCSLDLDQRCISQWQLEVVWWQERSKVITISQQLVYRCHIEVLLLSSINDCKLLTTSLKK